MAEVIKALDEAPDAIRDRFAIWRKARSEPGIQDQAIFALAMSSYLAGPDHAVRELAAAEVMWKARELIHEYLLGEVAAASSEQVAALGKLPWEAVPGAGEMVKRLEILSAIVLAHGTDPRRPRRGYHADAAPPRRRGRRRLSRPSTQ